MKAVKLYRDVRLGLKTLMLHKLRSLLTMLGVVFGVASVVAMLAVGEGASREALNEIRKLGSTNIIISSIKPVEDESGGNVTPFSMSIYGLLYEDQPRAQESLKTTAAPCRSRSSGRRAAWASARSTCASSARPRTGSTWCGVRSSPAGP